MSNFVKDIIDSLTTVIKNYTERSVSIRDVFMSVQKMLDGVPAEDGSIPPPAGYVLDVYADEAGLFAIITKDDGKLYKISVKVDADSNVTLGAEERVPMDFAPASRGLAIKRSADGTVRWFAMPACVAVLNRSGEVDSRALFDSFVDHIERTGQYPELDFFHLGEDVALGRADWVGRDDAAYCASGTFYDTDIARAAIRSLEELGSYWGLSIAYIPTSEPEMLRSTDGIEVPVFNTGINRFISILPEETAASILTAISIDGVNRMNEKIKKALEKLTGGDETLMNAIALKIDSVNRSATDMINREGEPAAVPVMPAVEAAPTEPVARALTAEDVAMIVGTDTFRNAVTEIVTSLMNEQNQAHAEPAAVAETVTEPAVADRSILNAIESLQEAVTALSVSREASVQEILDDLPARVVTTNIVRPRATRMPGSLQTAKSGKRDLASIANRTLQEMGE